MGKYDPLQEYLAAQNSRVNELVMKFDELEQMVGRLPNSARNSDVWWHKGGTVKPQIHAWHQAGWHVKSVDRVTMQILFARDKVSIEDENGNNPANILSAAEKPPGANAGQDQIDPISPEKRKRHERVLRWGAICAATAVPSAAAGISGIAGVTHLSWPALAVLTAAIALISLTIGKAAESHKEASASRTWWLTSTTLLLLAFAGSFIYHIYLDPASHAPQEYQFVVNGNDDNYIPLYGEAGGPVLIIETGTAGQNGLIGGETYNFDCWTTGLGGGPWLRYERPGQTLWAPRSLLHSPPGEGQEQVPHC